MSEDIKELAIAAAAMANAAAESQAQASQQLLEAAASFAKVQEMLLAPPPPPAPGRGWGQGRLSKLPFHSGARMQNDAAVQAFINAGRPGKPLDMIQCFNGREQARDWNDVAGGATDSLTEFDGTMSLKRGQKGAFHIWKAHPDLDAVLTYRPIPMSESNRNGENPKVWERVAGGEFNWVFKRAGRKLAGLDAMYPRKGRLIMEIAREMTGSWDQHSIKNAHQWWPKAFTNIVTQLRAGYREGSSGKDLPALIWMRPARSPVAKGVWTEAIMPPTEVLDGLGLSQHDNGWAPCTPKDPNRNWRREGNAEGLDNIGEIADKLGLGLGIFEWSSHEEGAENDSGDYPGLFTDSMWQWINRPEVLARFAGETYFLSDATTLAGKPKWEGTTAYRRNWGS